MRKLILITILIFLSTSLKAATITTRMSIDCATWLDSRKNPESSVALEHFSVGFLNGYAFGSHNNVWTTPNKISSRQLFYWLDNYCRENPLEFVTSGLLKFIDDRGHTQPPID